MANGTNETFRDGQILRFDGTGRQFPRAMFGARVRFMAGTFDPKLNLATVEWKNATWTVDIRDLRADVSR